MLILNRNSYCDFMKVYAAFKNSLLKKNRNIYT
jgi:hypothetical protein